MYGAFSHCLRGSYGWINLNATFKERKQLVDPWDNLTVNYENTLPRVKSNCIQRLTLVILPDDRRDGWIKAEQSSASSFVSDRNEKQSCPEADAARSQVTVSCAFSLLNFKEPDKCVCRSELWLIKSDVLYILFIISKYILLSLFWMHCYSCSRQPSLIFRDFWMVLKWYDSRLTLDLSALFITVILSLHGNVVYM